MNISIRVFDNGGITFDRFTVVIYNGNDASIYGMSLNADAPNGFNQYFGTPSEYPRLLDVLLGKKDKRIGREVSLVDLPDAVKQGIAKRLRK